MPYTIPPEPPIGSIPVEYDRLDYHHQMGQVNSIRAICGGINSDPNAEPSLKGIAELFGGIADLAAGRSEQGLSALRRALAGPEYIKVRAASELVIFLVGKGDIEGARALLAPHTASPPASAEFHYACGLFLGATGDSEGEWRELLQAASLNPFHLPTIKRLTVCGMIPERFGELERTFERFLDAEPQNGNIRTYYAAALLALGRAERSWCEVQRVVAFIELAPVDDEAIQILRSLTLAIKNLKGEDSP
ncbi:MAG: hypothetical protein RL417_1235 [Pseudomonadota bacterium]|jgi:tetratricopeptide (TPR) repeat protein